MTPFAFARAGFLALALVAGATGCKETGPDQTSFAGVGNVKVLSTQLVGSSDSATAIGTGVVSYVIAKIELTNNGETAWTPDLSHVYLLSRRGDRYSALTSGTSALIGVSNPTKPLEKGEKADYTVAFRTLDPSINGNIGYDY